MLASVSDRAWVQAMLDVEAALARAESRLGIIPAAAADGIATHCRVDEFDIAQLGRAAVRSATPVIPLVNALRAAVPKDAAPYVHHGATSQDILDTAMMLIARRGLGLVLADLEQAAAAAATLAERHRATVMAARTLLQQALPTTFGLKAAGWLIAIVEARAELFRVAQTRLAVQFGGAAGTMAALSGRGLDVMRELSVELTLAEPTLPWHTARARLVEVAAALGVAAGVAGKVALDVALMAQTEVGEVFERSVVGRAGSSALPQKHNPVDAIEILAGVRGINAQIAVLQAAMVQEQERAAGAWHICSLPVTAASARCKAAVVDHEIVLPCLAAIGRLLPTAGDLGLAGTDLGVEPLRELGRIAPHPPGAIAEAHPVDTRYPAVLGVQHAVVRF